MEVFGFSRPVVIDLAGLRARDRIPILLDHDTRAIVGQAKPTIGKDRVELTGVITGDDEPAQKVIMHAKNGFEWQASVGVSITKLESIGEKTAVTVNGRSMSGPMFVVREGRLRETSLLAVGADENTSSRIAAQRKELEMEFEKWVEAKGFVLDELSEEQASSLRAMYDAEQEGPQRAGADSESGNDAQESVNAEDDPVAAVNARAAENARRIAKIREICGDRHAEIEARAIEEGWSAERTELEVLRASRPNVTIRRSDDAGAHRAALEAALCLSAGISEDRVAESYDDRAMNAALGRDLRGAGLHTLLFETIRAAGDHVRASHVTNEVIRAALEADQKIVRAAGGFSTVSLSGILSNVANKVMLEAYRAVPSAITRIAAPRDVADFKTVTSYRLTGSGQFEQVGPDGELKHATLREESYTNQVATYGKMLTLTRQMMINDDLGAFLQIPRLLGRMSAQKVESVGFSLLLSNPNSFFSSGNGNYITGVDTNLSVGGLTLAEQQMLEQTDSNGDPVLIEPAFLLVPPALKVTAEQLMSEPRVNETTSTGKPSPANNPHVGKAQVVYSPYLKTEPKAWYLVADPADVAMIEIAYLRGRRVPTIESGSTDFNTLGVHWRGYFDFGIALQDKRAGVKSKGEA
ncbi:MAG: hypothetical protein D6744_11160 [Planctomycetota bacterium]|nr:MAG: hypothetical protein D6744_11160 [Planctomycetota bacterium]